MTPKEVFPDQNLNHGKDSVMLKQSASKSLWLGMSPGWSPVSIKSLSPLLFYFFFLIITTSTTSTTSTNALSKPPTSPEAQQSPSFSKVLLLYYNLIPQIPTTPSKPSSVMVERSSRRYNIDEDRYALSRRRRDDSRDNNRGKEVARRSEKKSSKHHSRPKSESDESEEDPKPKRKSKSDSRALVKSDSKSKDKKKKRRQKDDSDDDDDSENEVITTKRKRFEEVAYEDLEPEYIHALMDILEIKESRIDKSCHDGLIRLDTVEDCLTADKAVERHGDGKAAAEEWARFEKRYKKDIKARGGEKMRLGRGGETAGPSVSRSVVVRETPVLVFRERGYPFCGECAFLGYHCGNPFH